MRPPSPHPSQLRVFHIGGYWRGDNDIVRHMMLGLASAGADVFEYSTDRHRDALDTDGRFYDRGTSGPVWLRWDRLEDAIRDHAPDVIVCNAGGLSFRPDVAAQLRQRHCLIGIALSDPDVFEPSTRHIASAFDLFLTNAPECIPRYEALGARAALLPVATNPDFFRPAPPRAELACDVLVLGRAHPDRIEPVRALASRFNVHVYGEDWDRHGIHSRGFIYGDDVLAALASARIALVFFLTAGGHALVKVGLFDFTAAGALVATNRSPLVEKYFEYDREIIGFDGTEELMAKVAHLIDHPAEAEAVRQAGRARTLRDHSWAAVWRKVLAAAADGHAT